jgi:hypothetical protein
MLYIPSPAYGRKAIAGLKRRVWPKGHSGALLMEFPSFFQILNEKDELDKPFHKLGMIERMSSQI